jgi:hypothetical protein
LSATSMASVISASLMIAIVYISFAVLLCLSLLMWRR